ncbi:elongation factor G [Desulfolutivibrio sulfoxidireducens]|uniref:elongation factor G n=1 Tax=Desulfolutivibrio sulfoxidireducens TaxID=2773299 RepID=UPI00159D242E|nr:elongation factor G [Desulfolutivibrio sulfoxidireducens]QLA16180.1 elongation factor G [Desulfolutivibrio sulfoxidireducens]
MSSKKGPRKGGLAVIRNIGIIAHIDAGKTTLTERILYYSGKIHRMGEVHEGTATMDFMPEEQERGITIASACTTCPWRGHRVNIIDTPGHVDFTIEVERCLRVLDGAVGVFCAVAGVEPQSETVWRQSELHSVPKLAFVNKMDRLGADFQAAFSAMRTILKAPVVALQIPVGAGQDFSGVIDLLTMEKLVFDQTTQGEHYARLPLSEAEADMAGPWREAMVEAICERDEALVEDYLGGQEIALDRLRAAIRTATLERSLVPVLCGSALKNIGVQPLLDAVCDFLPSPEDRGGARGVDPATGEAKTFPPSPDAPLAALVFKVSMETGRRHVFLRVYSGRLAAGEEVRNVTRNENERAARLFSMHASHREKIDVVSAGDIALASGMRHARTGDTLCHAGAPILLETIAAYKPVISLALEPRNVEESDRLKEVLGKLLQEDPTLTLEHDEETDQIILSGMGELHLEVVLERVRREYGLSPRAGKPQVVYQETVAAEGVGEAEFLRELAEKEHYGHVAVRVSPLPRESGRDIGFAIDRAGYPVAWLDALAEGLADGLQSGTLRGYPVVDVRVRVTGLKIMEGKSSAVGYRMAAHQALKNALAQASPKLLEPIMFLEITVPDQFVGDVAGLLGSSGAKIENMFDRAGQKIVQALAPLRRLFGFSTQLRSATQGRAGMVMKFSKFDVLQ